MTRKNSYNDMSAESLWVSHQLLELLETVGLDGEGVTLIPKRGCTYNASVHGISSDESSASEDDEESEDGGEQTNCCEATGSSTTSTCVSSSFICQGGSVATAHAKCAASVCVESEFSSVSGRCCESPEILVS